MRVLGLDVHRTFAEVAIWEEGVVRSAGRINLTREALETFANSLSPTDEVVLEATGNTHAVVRMLHGHARRVVISNPLRTRAIADAKVKTDKIDATVLAQLHASGFLLEVWMPDETTEQLRRQGRRAQLVRHRTRLKNQIHSILHRNLVPPCPATDLFGQKGRVWLGQQALPPDEQRTVESLLRALDFTGTDLAAIDHDLAEIALGEPAAKRLMTIPGVDMAGGRRYWGHHAVSLAAEAGELLRAESAGPAIRAAARSPWAHYQTRARARAGHARRSRLGGGEDPGLFPRKSAKENRSSRVAAATVKSGAGSPGCTGGRSISLVILKASSDRRQTQTPSSLGHPARGRVGMMQPTILAPL
jgi:transposase